MQTRPEEHGVSGEPLSERGVLAVFGERLLLLVSPGEDGVFGGPLYRDVRIVPGNSALGFGMIERGLFVLHFAAFRQRQEAVGKSRRDIKLRFVLRGEFYPEPLPKRFGTCAEINSHVENSAQRATDQLGHRGSHILIVHAAEHSVGGGRVRILDEVGDDSGGRKRVPVPTFQKEPALILKEVNVHNEQAR